MELTQGASVLLYTVVFACAVLRGITGFGFAIAAVPVISLFLPPEISVAYITLLQALIGLYDVPTCRKEAHWSSVSWFSISSLVGIPLGVYLLTMLDGNIVRIVIAGVVIFAVIGLISKRGLPIKANIRSAIPCGVFGGLFAGLASMPGPPAILYFLGSGIAPVQARASMIIFFFFTSLIAIPFLYAAELIDKAMLIYAVLGLPIFIAGSKVGEMIFKRTSDIGYKKISIVLLIITALLTALKGISGLL
ncbi:sulfite exporter TauE/SafE family protein [Agarilytica rhodophyticola]|uniref:sulfite exporter TauE/SafE family protein n=1 Tax=Agarilytica rhodophyticola TaxID=1737490 RepID=UPI000B341C34|nr:sulfite exporter TauE/SafE family protein [Agarilytica rhodophyticola]